jgi:DNA-binding PadR family transcriptional regulator
MEYPNETQDKLIVLYIINRLNKSITNLQMVDFVLEATGIDYFTLQDILIQLQENSLIDLFYEEEVRYYKITDQGKDMLNSLITIIPDFIVARIDEKIQENQKEIKQKSVVYADFFPEGKDNFMVKCKISEGGKKLIELNLSVPTREQAIDICNKWYESPSKYYLEIIKLLGNS